MNVEQERARLLRALTDSFAEAEATLATADTSRVVYTDSGWTVKDLVAHVAAWEAEMLRSLEAYCEGREYAVEGYIDDDSQNAIYYQRSKVTPFETTFAAWRVIRERLKSLIEHMPPEKFEGEMLYPWHQRGILSRMIGSTVGHQSEHLAHIQRALRGAVDDTRGDTLAMLETAYREAHEALRDDNPERVIYVESGWKLKDLVTHVAMWEHEMYRSLEAFHQGGEYQIDNYELDPVNWRAYEARKDWTWDAILADWQTSRNRIHSILMAMTDGQMQRSAPYPWGRRGNMMFLFDSTVSHQQEHISHILLSRDRGSDEDQSRLARLIHESILEANELLKSDDMEIVVYQESGWRVKDILAHVYAWDAAVARALRAYREGGTWSIPNYPGVDAFNEAQYQRHKDRPAYWIHELFMLARTDILNQVAQMTPEQLAGEMTYPSGRRGNVRALVEETVDHGDEHFADIAAALGVG